MTKTVIIIVGALVLLGIISFATVSLIKKPAATTNPSATASAQPTQSPSITPSNPASSSPQASITQEKQTVKVYLVSLGNDGKNGQKIGCGDSLVAVDREITKTPAVLRSALTELLSIKKSEYQNTGLYSAFYNSNLKIENVTLENGKAIIKLTGALSLGGVCDDPRVQEQLVQTAKQFSTVKDVEIFINGKPLQDVLSEKG